MGLFGFMVCDLYLVLVDYCSLVVAFAVYWFNRF